MFSEHDIDRELKAALSVSPSPDFAARVLQRVEEDRPASWAARYGWLAAAACLLIAAGVIYALTRTSPVVSEPPAPQVVERPAPRVDMPRYEAPAPARAQRRTPVGAVREPPTARVRERRTAEPAVIVPLNQMEAVRRLVLAVNEGRLKPPVEPPAEPSQGPMAPPANVSVAPVVVEPIRLSPLSPGREGK
jgi:hypothetical protein